ncbi:hypothetical protein WJU16_21625 [Chitinophaga pollutisoli]|uniref:Sulfotransferase family protein n=1 Tax=Chitinophaga pollutisoli TaxID=3133966 RepID=A0ABZ2YMP2_9BACT
MQTFIKQYGEKRTGTNYLRALLTAACPDAKVLMHVLGDKHEAPPEALLAAVGALSPRELTLRHASATTHAADADQEAYTGALANELEAALRRRELFFCISVKKPYAWAYSILKQHGAADSRRLPAQRLRLLQTVLSSALHEFNRKYAAWRQLEEHWPGRSVIVRYETLLDQPAEIIAGICRKMALPLDASKAQPIEKIVLPAHWDFSPPQTHHENFDADFYRSGGYLGKMHATLIEIVDQQTDWPLMAAYGYRNVSTFQK